MKSLLMSISFGLALITASCVTSSRVASFSKSKTVKSVGKMALVSGSSVLGDAISLELVKNGFEILELSSKEVVDSPDASSSGTQVFTSVTINGRSMRNNSNIENLSNEKISELAKKGIKTLMIVKYMDGSIFNQDNDPQNVSVKIIDTKSSQIIGGSSWQNNKGAFVKRGIAEAAEEIVEDLTKVIKP